MNNENKVVWGILGTAGIAYRKMIPAMLSSKNCALKAIAGRDPAKVSRFCSEFGIPKGYDHYEQLLEDKEIEAVYIPLSIDLHAKWTIEAAKHGKHVLCEKPLAVSATEAAEMIQVCQNCNVLLMEAIPYLNGELIKRVKEIIASREIGDVISVVSEFTTCRHPSNNIRNLRSNYGGATYDMGCYNTSLALTLLGDEPESVHACCTKTPELIDDSSSIILDFNTPLHRRALCSAGMVLGGRQVLMRYVIGGASGRIEVNNKAFNESGDILIDIITDLGKRQESVFVTDNYRQEIENFSSCILYGGELPVSHEHSLSNARVIDCALRQMNYGRY